MTDDHSDLSAVVPHSRLDTGTLPEAERFPLFRRALAATHDAYRCDGDKRPFEAQLDVWLLGEMLITAGWQTASRMVRVADRVASDGIDYLTVMLVREGLVTGQGGMRISCGAGQVLILDLAQTMDVQTSDNRNIGVRLSRALLGKFLHPLPDLHGAVFDGTVARVISDHFVSLVQHARAIPFEDVAIVARATAAIVAECLTTMPSPAELMLTSRTAAIRTRVAQYVEANLTSPSLRPDTLPDMLGMSRSSIYRAFEIHGGIALYVRNQRIETIHGLLGDPRESRSISELAFAFGFSSSEHFSTTFRRRFGYTAREVRGRGNGIALASDRHSTHVAYQKWLEGLGDREDRMI